MADCYYIAKLKLLTEVLYLGRALVYKYTYIYY